MNTGIILNTLTEYAKKYRTDCAQSINRNHHMNDLRTDSLVSQEVVDAILVDFINYVGIRNCCDYGLYTKDIK